MQSRNAASPPTDQPWEPKIIAFVCNWCSYVGADLAGTSRLAYPENVRIIRVPCSGRIDPVFIVRSFQRGVDGVLISGCHPGDCHYNKGNYYARRRMLMLTKLLEFSGLDPARIQMSWVSASEGGKWAQIMADLTEQIKKLGPAQYSGGLAGWPGADGGNGNGNGGNGHAHESTVDLPRLRFDSPCEHGDRSLDAQVEAGSHRSAVNKEH